MVWLADAPTPSFEIGIPLLILGAGLAITIGTG
jgi:hypothetical protein